MILNPKISDPMDNESTIYRPPIMMTEEYWADSMYSVVRHTGVIRINGQEYIICNQHGQDIFECSAIAARNGKDKAIESGEPCDLVIREWLPVYRAVGRQRFLGIAKATCDLAEAREMAGIAPTPKKKKK